MRDIKPTKDMIELLDYAEKNLLFNSYPLNLAILLQEEFPGLSLEEAKQVVKKWREGKEK